MSKNLFELLTEHEKEMISASINTYAFHDGGGSHTASLEYILRYWNSNKQDLFKMFNENLILSKRVEIKADTYELMTHIDKELLGSSEYSIFVDNYFRTMVWDEDRLINNNFITNRLRSLISNQSLAENVYNDRSFELTLPNGKTMSIITGCKVSRMLGKIAKEYNIPGYESFRLKHSQLLNQKAFIGELCLSIHPLDYITMSDNNSNWSSCMSWEDNGCYRSGTVEMMNSTFVVVAYLRGEEDMSICDCSDWKWANKKWRELFIVSDGIITNVLGYPYRNKELSKLCLEWLHSLASKAGYQYTNEIYDYAAWEDFYIDELDKTVRFDPVTNEMYNDFGSSHVGYFGKNIEEGTIHINYSGPAVCLCCGEIAEFDYEGSLVCDECEPIYSCDSCGDRYNEDELYELDGSRYCEYCYDRYVAECDFSHESHHEDNMILVYLAHKDENGEILFSKSSFNMYYDYKQDLVDAGFAKKLTILHEKNRFGWRTANVILDTDMTEKTYELFGFCDKDEYEEYLAETSDVFRSDEITYEVDTEYVCVNAKAC